MAEEIISRDAQVTIQISGDGMEAYMTIQPPIGEGKWLTKKDVLDALKANKVVSGVDEDAISLAIELRTTGEAKLVASGREAVRGTDAELKVLFSDDLADSGLDEDEFGRVDYRELQKVKNVVSGQVLVEKIPATPGITGYTVLGRELKATSGKDRVIPKGKNVVLTKDGLRAVSTIDGEPALVGGKINVFPVHEVRGDVDFETGNISFLGSIIVHGNVNAGFKVEAQGDITVYGMVEAAKLVAGGNILITGGVAGMEKAEITCTGDFTAKFCEYAKVVCGGTVSVKEAIMYCQVNAENRIEVSAGKGMIVGGTLTAGEEILAKVIGSRFGTTTELEVGVKPNMLAEYNELGDKLKEIELSLEKVNEVMSMLEKLPRLNPEQEATYQNLKNTSSENRQQSMVIKARREAINRALSLLIRDNARIRVSGTIFPGVRITISNASLVLKDEYRYTVAAYVDGNIDFQTFSK